MDKENKAVQIRTAKVQEQLIDCLKRTPIIEAACNKVGIGRNSYYRWRRQSKKFAEACDKALLEGYELINDLAESQLISAMKDGNMSSVFFWLNNRHVAYGNKLKISGSIETKSDKLTPEQEASIHKALTLMGLTNNNVQTKGGQNESKTE